MEKKLPNNGPEDKKPTAPQQKPAAKKPAPKRPKLPDVKDDPFPMDSWLIYLVSIIGAFIFGVAAYKEFNPEYKKYQVEFKRLIEMKFGTEAAEKVPMGVQQIWVKDLNRVDRCITCHMGYEWRGLEGEDVPEVFRTHPDLDGLIAKHPFKDYGCTTCHGGQGYATNMKEAHVIQKGKKVRWLEPLLGKEKAKEYKFADWQKMPLMEINCNTCHRHEDSLPGTPYINLAKKLWNEKGCIGCHKLFGEGGDIGPDLTYEGSKSHESFDIHAPYYVIKNGKPVPSGRTIAQEMKRRGLPLSVFSWHLLHFEEPRSITPTSAMPNFGLNEKEKRALAMLMMSWKRVNLPAKYIPKMEGRGAAAPKVDTAAADTTAETADTAVADTTAKMEETPKVSYDPELAKRGEELFDRKGCTACHDLDSRKVGPPLRDVAARRDHEWLKHMIMKPDSMILNDPIAQELLQEFSVPMTNQNVSEEEAKAIIEFLKKAATEK
ncbi:MAG: c-type cytochrome [Thermotogae bacterium]|nr:c-type cytochrome [Thermotogota bacterium]